MIGVLTAGALQSEGCDVVSEANGQHRHVVMAARELLVFAISRDQFFDCRTRITRIRRFRSIGQLSLARVARRRRHPVAVHPQ